jgi:hypothetical protein
VNRLYLKENDDDDDDDDDLVLMHREGYIYVYRPIFMCVLFHFPAFSYISSFILFSFFMLLSFRHELCPISSFHAFLLHTFLFPSISHHVLVF